MMANGAFGGSIRPFGGAEPIIAPDAWIAPNATVVGKATIGALASIYYGAVVRADLAEIRLGERSNIQDNCVIHTDPGYPASIGAGVSVGHGAVLHGCTIGDDCLIGMNATVLTGAVVGAGSLIAAGSVILEGSVIPSGSLVAGVPGRVRRPLSEGERDAITRNADVYVALSIEHAASHVTR